MSLKKKFNKKGQVLTIMGMIIAALLLIIFIGQALAPIVTGVANQGTNSCPNTNSSLPDLDTSINLCINSTQGAGAGNETPLFTNTIASRDRSILGILSLLAIVGVVAFIALSIKAKRNN